MNINRIREEMQFITNVITSDIDYLMYLLLKKPKSPTEVNNLIVDKKEDNIYTKEDLLEDWFNKL